MSQRLNSGANAPRPPVVAGDRLICRPSSPLIGVFSSVLAPSLWSRPVGVAHPVIAA